jgi:hypothetical protein
VLLRPTANASSHPLEITLAKFAWLIIGDSRISWADVVTVFRKLYRHSGPQAVGSGLHGQSRVALRDLLLNSKVLGHCMICVVYRVSNRTNLSTANIRTPATEAGDFAMYLIFSSRTSCSDTRDKVYGLLGLCDNEILRSVSIDYHLKLSEILTRVMVYLVQSLKTLAISIPVMFHIPGTSQGNASPWVPYLSPKGPRRYFKDLMKENRLYAASKDRDFCPRFSSDLNTLSVEGISIDRITRVSEPLKRLDLESILPWMILFDLPNRAHETYPFRCLGSYSGCKRGLEAHSWSAGGSSFYE